MSDRPPREVEADAELVHKLLQEQHPDLAELPIQWEAEGWDNFMFRLGDDLAVRMPRRQVGADLADNERAILPQIAECTPYQVPAPIRFGESGCGYPWPWSVVTWSKGKTADTHPPAPEEAARFGQFLRELHDSRVEIAHRNPFRDQPLDAFAERFDLRLGECIKEGLISNAEVKELRRVFECGSQLTPVSCLIHGDLHPQNVLVQEGKITAIIDWGDACHGEPGVDLMAVYALFDLEHHAAFWAAYGEDEATLARTRACCAVLGVLWLATSGHDPAFRAVSRLSLDRLLG